MIFETATNQMDAIGKQGRGERITLITKITATVKAEFDLDGAVDAAPAG